MSMSMPAKARSNRKVKAKEEKERVVSRIGDKHAMTIGHQMDVNMVTIGRSITPGGDAGDARDAGQCPAALHGALLTRSGTSIACTMNSVDLQPRACLLVLNALAPGSMLKVGTAILFALSLAPNMYW